MKNLVTFTFKSLLLLVFVMSSPMVMANTGKVFNVEGTVMVNGAPLEIGTEIKQGDVIKTGADGKVMIVMSDRSVVNLDPNTDFKIDEYKYSGGEAGSGKSKFDLVKGAFRYISGLISKNNPDDVAIKSGSATIGIRGSDVSFTNPDGTTVTITTTIGSASMSITNPTTGETTTVDLATGTQTVTNTATGDVISSTTAPPNPVALAAAALAQTPPDTTALDALSDADKAIALATLMNNSTSLGASSDQVLAAVGAIAASNPALATQVTSLAVSLNPNAAAAIGNAVNTAIGATTAAQRAAVNAAAKAAAEAVGGSPVSIDPETGELSSGS